MRYIIAFFGFLIFFDILLCNIYSRYSQRKKNTKSQTVKSVVAPQKKVEQHTNKKGLKALLRCIVKKVEPYLYGLCRYSVILVGKIPSHRVRKFILRKVFLMKIHPKAIIYGGFEIRSPWNIKLGRCIVGVGALLDGRNGIEIEDDVCLAQNVYIYTEQHDLNDPWFRCNDKGGMVKIKKRAWISSRTTILPKVEVGEGSVLASGAIATKSLESYGVYAGIPAKKISERNRNLEYELCRSDYWHFY